MPGDDDDLVPLAFGSRDGISGTGWYGWSEALASGCCDGLASSEPALGSDKGCVMDEAPKTPYRCDFCDSVADYLVSLDQKVQDDFQITIGDMRTCRSCLSKAVDIGIRLFGNELSICGREGL